MLERAEGRGKEEGAAAITLQDRGLYGSLVLPKIRMASVSLTVIA